VSGDPNARPSDESPPACPKCGRAARRRHSPAQRLPRRQLQTPVGRPNKGTGYIRPGVAGGMYPVPLFGRLLHPAL
jgi:hypothetical protein